MSWNFPIYHISDILPSRTLLLLLLLLLLLQHIFCCFCFCCFCCCCCCCCSCCSTFFARFFNATFSKKIFSFQFSARGCFALKHFDALYVHHRISISRVHSNNMIHHFCWCCCCCCFLLLLLLQCWMKTIMHNGRLR